MLCFCKKFGNKEQHGIRNLENLVEFPGVVMTLTGLEQPPQGSAKGRGEGEGPPERARGKKV